MFAAVASPSLRRRHVVRAGSGPGRRPEVVRDHQGDAELRRRARRSRRRRPSGWRSGWTCGSSRPTATSGLTFPEGRLRRRVRRVPLLRRARPLGRRRLPQHRALELVRGLRGRPVRRRARQRLAARPRDRRGACAGRRASTRTSSSRPRPSTWAAFTEVGIRFDEFANQPGGDHACTMGVVGAGDARRRVALGCGPKVKPGLGVVGDKTVATFDRAMVGDDKLGGRRRGRAGAHEAGGAGEVPLARRAHADAFVPDEALPRSTKLRAGGAAPGTTALDGFGLAKAVKWSFETERLRVTLGSRPGKWATPDQRIAVAFNQPVRRRDVEKRCGYVSDAQARGGGRRQHGRGRRTRATSFAVLPHEPLALATKWRFECSPRADGRRGAAGARDSVGRAARAPATRRACEPDRVRDLRSVQGHVGRRPRGGEISPDEASIVITFSNPLDVDTPPRCRSRSSRRSTASPSAPRSSTTASATRCARCSPNTRYTITVDAARRRRFGQRLAGPVRRRVRHRRRHAPPGRRDGRVGRRGDAARVSRVVAQPHHARGRRHRGARGEARRARRPARLVGPGRGRRRRRSGSRRNTSTIPIKGRKNQWDQIQIEPAKLLGSASPPAGFYYVALRAPEEPHPGGPSRPRARCCSTSRTWASPRSCRDRRGWSGSRGCPTGSRSRAPRCRSATPQGQGPLARHDRRGRPAS